MKKLLTIFLVFCTFIACLGWSACVFGSQPKESFSFAETEYRIEKGTRKKLKFQSWNMEDFTTKNIKVTSSDRKIAKIDGLYVVGVAEGNATLTATYEDRLTAEVAIEVREPLDPNEPIPTSMVFREARYETIVGKDVRLKLYTDPISNYQPSLLTVTVENNGVVRGAQLTYTGEKVGKATVTASYNGGEYTAQTEIEVRALATSEEIDSFSENAVVIQGRAYKNNSAYVFDNVNSGVEYSFYGTKSQVSFTVPESYKGSPAYIGIYVDDEDCRFLPLGRMGENVYTVAENLQEGVHKISILKATEQHLWTAGARSITMNKIVESEHCKIVKQSSQADRLKIDFYGDSITCGLSNLGSATDYATSEENGTLSYAAIAGRSLNALVSCVAYSGITVACEYNLGATNMTGIWDLDSAIHGEKYTIATDTDFVVINLGTNDSSAYNHGKTTKEEIGAAVKNLLQEMRSAYGEKTKFIWAYGMMWEDEVISSQVQAVMAELGGEESGYYYLSLSPNHINGRGGHPLVAGHEIAAQTLVRRIEGILQNH